MTRDEFVDKRADIVSAYYVDSAGDSNIVKIMQALNELDEQYAAAQKSPQDAFYAFLVRLDADYKAIKSAQGNAARLKTAIDHTMATLSAYAESLEE